MLGPVGGLNGEFGQNPPFVLLEDIPAGRQKACGRHSCSEQRGEHCSSRRADQVVGFARVPARDTVERSQGAGHPGTAQNTSGAQGNPHTWPPGRLPVTLALCRPLIRQLPLLRQATGRKRAKEWAIRPGDTVRLRGCGRQSRLNRDRCAFSSIPPKEPGMAFQQGCGQRLDGANSLSDDVLAVSEMLMGKSQSLVTAGRRLADEHLDGV